MHFKSPADEAEFQAAILHAYCAAAGEFVGVTRLGARHFICANEQGAALFGYAGAEAMLAHAHDLLECLTDEELRQTGDAALTKEAVFTTVQGSTFFALVRISHFTFREHTYSLVRITNIDREKKTELLGKRGSERFEAMFNHASMGIVVADSSGTVVTANAMAAAQFGCTGSALTGIKVEELIPMQYRERHVQHRQQYNAAPRPRMMGTGVDLFARKMDGTTFPVEISLSNFNTDEGSYVIAFVIDITRRKQIEADVLRQQELIEKLNNELEDKVALRTSQLQEAMQQLEASREELSRALNKEKELGDMKSRFVSMASHEFRTPLSTILSSASLVARYTLTEEQEKRDRHIQRIKSSVNNLTDILNEFLSLGKMEDGKVTASPVYFNLKELLGSIALEMQGHARPGQEIVFSYRGGETVFLDPALLRNAVVNLLSNAIKFSPGQQPVALSALQQDGGLTIRVQDQGIGISGEDQKHLFERFFRGNNAVNIQGTGLGLHIVAKYAELLGGEIEYTSELEKGTTFTLKFDSVTGPAA